MIQEKRLVDEFIELVQVDSETTFEKEISIVLKEKFAQLGLSVFEDDAEEKTEHGAGNLVATLEATEGKEDVSPIYFTCHMDTVAPGKGIKPQIDDDGYIRSDGTTILGSDDKTGIAVMFELIRVLKEDKIPHGKIQFVITVGEEAGLVGACAFDPKHLEASFGYALDSDGKVGEICVAAPFQTHVDVVIKGKTAHAGVSPEKGISAIQVASKAISRMKLGRIDPETSANIGSFDGRGPRNVVSDKVVIVAEARSLVKEKMVNQVNEMRDAFYSVAEEFGAQVEFETEELPGFFFDETAPLVKLAMKSAEKIGRESKITHSGGASDANIFNGMDVPTVNLSVGYENIHTTAEQMPIEELVKSAELVLQIVKDVTDGE
ncbi:M20/M25/M40 family metallo-hydrolase [Chengkuizengella marina]|uniref:M20/M25/M40 family metallo-hydrolase n=1 Tax=Chengkuizengella marina TaxID=2507566 RepID=A0A6N9PXA9_9BACL|nr:M20/M25/M40 family metallo-hydrolase [Chengkuizengella marina]NBI27637.1 M20/M25/M40 family metallo-hydrolase [Chengkuizengella marina]